MDFRFLQKCEPQLLAILRIVTALLFIEHGTVKLFGFPTAFQMAGPLPPLLLAGAIIEIVAGVLVLIGLFMRPAAFMAAGEMAVAYWMFHAPQGPWPIVNMGEGAILYCFIFLYLAAAGPGAWSLDGARFRSRMPR